MTIWSNAIEHECHPRVSSFTDDGNFRADGPDHAQRTTKATQVSLELDSLSGTETNLSKTKHYAITHKAENEL
eukprot:1267229-Pyramimonas_sp.AAC.1